MWTLAGGSCGSKVAPFTARNRCTSRVTTIAAAVGLPPDAGAPAAQLAAARAIAVVPGKCSSVPANKPHDPFAGHELGYLLLGDVQVLVAVGKDTTHLVRRTFELPRPPSARVGDRIEHIRRCPLHRDRRRVVLTAHGALLCRSRGVTIR